MDIDLNKYKIIIIIGLPGSGKTFLSKIIEKRFTSVEEHEKRNMSLEERIDTESIYRERNVSRYDDFLFEYWNGELITDIKNNKKVVINDPRLCYFKTFKRYIMEFEKYINRNNILLILFKNKPEVCFYNVDKQKNITKKYMYQISSEYDIEKYNKWECIIHDVFGNYD